MSMYEDARVKITNKAIYFKQNNFVFTLKEWVQFASAAFDDWSAKRKVLYVEGRRTDAWGEMRWEDGRLDFGVAEQTRIWYDAVLSSVHRVDFGARDHWLYLIPAIEQYISGNSPNETFLIHCLDSDFTNPNWTKSNLRRLLPVINAWVAGATLSNKINSTKRIGKTYTSALHSKKILFYRMDYFAQMPPTSRTVVECWTKDSGPQSFWATYKSGDSGVAYELDKNATGYCKKGGNGLTFERLYKDYVQINGEPCATVREIKVPGQIIYPLPE